MTITSAAPVHDWCSANQLYLMNRLAQVRAVLKQDGMGVERSELEAVPESLPDSASTWPGFALAQLAQRFGLSRFEQDLLLLCAGMELDGEWALLCEQVQGRGYPTFGLALAVLPGADWSAIAPSGPLRRWHLLEIGPGDALTTSPLRIDERILHYLTGIEQLDERLLKLLSGVPPSQLLTASHQSIVEQIIQSWQQAHDAREVPPVVQLVGEDRLSKGAIAVAATQQVGLLVMEIAVAGLPLDWGEFELVRLLFEREATLTNLAFLIDFEGLEAGDAARRRQVEVFVNTTQVYLLKSCGDRQSTGGRAQLTHEVRLPSLGEQRRLWQQGLQERFLPQVDPIVAQFNLGAAAIQSACLLANSLPEGEAGGSGKACGDGEDALLAGSLWDICRTQARPTLEELAQRIPVSATWQDLVLPEKERAILEEISAHVKYRTRVYEDWGFGGKSQRGLGISALFAGASGTGKTTAAEVIADALSLDLYRIDLSTVVSKYIGETEKNLRRIFDAAEGGGAILLFDEADALFGKRSEVTDSKDRYANMEVSYLLQRMESYRGLAILTTNLKQAMDQAFLRRIRFVVQFPFPDVKLRAEIWRRVFPVAVPKEGLAYGKLARLNIAGGNIRNIAVNGAFLAAEAGEAVQMQHLLLAARREYVKLERPLTDSEVRGWV